MKRAALQGFLGSLLAFAGMLGLCTSASAETIELGGATGTEYFHEGLLVRPSSFDVNDFFSNVAGTVTVSIQRIDWGDLFSQLSTAISLAGPEDLKYTGNAVITFDVTAGESFATSIYAQVSGQLGYGAYRLDVLFLPKMSQVPLPAAGWLLVSGVGLLAGMRRRRVTPALA